MILYPLFAKVYDIFWFVDTFVELIVAGGGALAQLAMPMLIYMLGIMASSHDECDVL